MNDYAVYYNSWRIEVKADNPKQAKHRAYSIFNMTFPVAYGKFMSGIEEVMKLNV